MIWFTQIPHMHILQKPYNLLSEKTIKKFKNLIIFIFQEISKIIKLNEFLLHWNMCNVGDTILPPHMLQKNLYVSIFILKNLQLKFIKRQVDQSKIKTVIPYQNNLFEPVTKEPLNYQLDSST